MLDTHNCLQNHIKNAKATKFLLQSAFYTSKGSTCKVLPFYGFWFKFYDKLCSPDRRLLMHIESPKSGSVTLSRLVLFQTSTVSAIPLLLLKQYKCCRGLFFIVSQLDKCLKSMAFFFFLGGGLFFEEYSHFCPPE